MALTPSSSHGGGNTTAQVVASGKVIPVAVPTGATVNTTAYDNQFSGGKLSTLVMPAVDSAFAFAVSGDANPRVVFTNDGASGFYFGNGTFDPVLSINAVSLIWSSNGTGRIGGQLQVNAATDPSNAPQLLQLSPVATITSGALPAFSAWVSGTAKQNATSRDIETWTPVTFNPLAADATCLVEISPDNVTFSTLGVKTMKAGLANGEIELLNVRVPKGWYLKLTVTNATIGTTTYY